MHNPRHTNRVIKLHETFMKYWICVKNKYNYLLCLKAYSDKLTAIEYL